MRNSIEIRSGFGGDEDGTLECREYDNCIEVQVNDGDELYACVNITYPQLATLHHWLGEALRTENERRNSPEARAKWTQVLSASGANFKDSDGEVE